MDFFDVLLAKKLEDDRDPKVEGLSVTQNGRYHEDGVVYDPVIVEVPETTLTTLNATENRTYTAPSGTAYNEVDVDVPLPENAYLLKELSNLPQPIASFSDGADAVMQSLKVSIEPVQSGSGDPSPTNVRPISGWSGVNVYDGSGNLCDITKFTHTGVTNDSGSVNTMNSRLFSDKIFIKPNYDYTYTIVGRAGSVDPQNIYCNRIIYYDASGTFLSRYNPTTVSSATFTPSANARYFVLDLKTYSNYDIEISDITSIMVNIGSTAQDFEPYAGTTTTIPFTDSQGNPVEVYGGSVDVVNGGEQPRTLGSIDLSTLSWTFTGTYGSATNIFSAFLETAVVAGTTIADAFCNIYKTIDNESLYANGENNTFSLVRSASDQYARIRINDTAYSDVQAFKTALQNADAKLVYPLATPTTFYTQPTAVKSLDGVNNVFASTGDVEELKYFTKATS